MNSMNIGDKIMINGVLNAVIGQTTITGHDYDVNITSSGDLLSINDDGEPVIYNAGTWVCVETEDVF